MRLVLLWAGLLATGVVGQADFPWLPQRTRENIKRYFMASSLMLQKYVGNTASSSRHLRNARQAQKLQDEMPKWMEFPCKKNGTKSDQVPESVDRLRPGDIKVVGALGDSLTAGFGAAASSLYQVFGMNRGLSWSIGGQGSWRQYLTLPNMLKEFNPELVGYSLGDSNSFEYAAQFNVAEGGAMTHDMPFMATELVHRMKNDSRVNISKDWKMITIMIGSNDYCADMCYYNMDKYLARRRQNLIKTLDILLENLPRTFVNLVMSPNAATIIPKYVVSPSCWMILKFECPCVLSPQFSPIKKKYEQMVHKSQNLEIQVADMKKYQKEDFAVVLQPFLHHLHFPTMKESPTNVKTDMSYLSQDCFHLSQRGYSRAANALWNNMLEPVGSKTTDWRKEFEQVLCPTEERPYFFTKNNS